MKLTNELTRRGAKDLAQRLIGPDVGVYIDKAAPTRTQRFGMERQLERLDLQLADARGNGDDVLASRLVALRDRITQALAVPRYCLVRRSIVNGKTVVQTLGIGHSWQEAFDAAVGTHVPLDQWLSAEVIDAPGA